MKNFRKLASDARGFSHDMVLVFIVVVVAIGGSYYLVASHADTNQVAGQIVYTNYTTDNTAGVWIANDDGQSGYALTSPPAGDLDEYPTWSPNGQQIAFVRMSDNNTVSSLMVMNANGTGQVALPTAGYNIPNGLVWSPNGTQIAAGADLLSTGANAVLLVNLNGTAPSTVPNITTGGTTILFGWSNSSLYYSAAVSPSNNPVTNNICSITTTGTDTSCFAQGYDPSLSPNGTQIAYVGWNGNSVGVVTDDTLHVMSSTGTGSSVVVPANKFTSVNNFSWTPDSSTIIFNANGTKQANPEGWYTVETDGANLARLNISDGGQVDGNWPLSWGAAPVDVPVPAAYNGGNKTEIAVFETTNSTWHISANNSGTSTSIVQWGVAGDIPVPGDYLGNGVDQIAVWRPSNGTWYVNGGPTIQWGERGDIPAEATYGGGDKVIPAVYRPSNGTLYVYGIGYYTMKDPQDTSGVVPVPADYNGAGAAQPVVIPSLPPSDLPSDCWLDLATNTCLSNYGTTTLNAPYIYVPGTYGGAGTPAREAVYELSGSIWHIANSAGTATQSIYQWGTAGDIPVPGDYTGNGTTNIAVWRPSNATWYIYGVKNVQYGVPY